MAGTRRRSARTQKAPEPAPASATAGDDPKPQVVHNGEEENDKQAQEERCPACEEGEPALSQAVAEKEKWVRCDACKTWFHWRCAGQEGLDVDTVDKWFCTPCSSVDPARVITMKPPARKSARKKTQRDYAGLNAGQEADPTRWLRMMEGKTIKKDPFKRMQGGEVGLEWLENDESAMKEPIVIESEEGLGMEMPSTGFTVDDVADALGREHPVEVIDVATQSNLPNWNLGKWADYCNTEEEKRDRIRNVISLEISGTELADKVLPPRLVRELDWVEKFWPNTKKGRGHSYPKVQLYCLMGVSGAWTDWHVDFAGSSVYYHILHGTKVFYFIRPTPANLAAYERWSGTDVQNHSWLGDMCDEVFKVELKTGNTMIIPTGWIHAVYTPEDTVVFGGNFIHSYNIPTQLRVRAIEIATHVPKKFRFPYFTKLCWYAGEKYLRDLKGKEEFSRRVLEGVEALADFLVAEARIIERGNDAAKRQAKDEVPGDRIKDAPALARELRWRVRHAGGSLSDDESRSSRRGKGAINGHGELTPNGVGSKRKRVTTDNDHGEDYTRTELFRNFKVPRWDVVEELPSERTSETGKTRRPDEHSENWAQEWVRWPKDDKMEDGEDARIERKRDVIVKVRRTAKGLERQRVERVLEEWVWEGAVLKMEDADASMAEDPSPAKDGDATMNDVAAAGGGSNGETREECG